MWKAPDDGIVREILSTCRNIVVIGLSPKPERDSHRVTRYMQAAGYLITGINPGHREILSRPCYPTLGDIPAGEPIEIVNIFRRSDRVGPHVDEVIERGGARCIWMQVGIVDRGAAERAARAGITVVMDRCLMVEHRALLRR